MPPDVTIVEEHKRDISEAKQLDRKLVKLVLPTDKNEEKDKEDDKNEKVVLHSQHWMNAESFPKFYISFFLSLCHGGYVAAGFDHKTTFYVM